MQHKAVATTKTNSSVFSNMHLQPTSVFFSRAEIFFPQVWFVWRSQKIVVTRNLTLTLCQNSGPTETPASCSVHLI